MKTEWYWKRKLTGLCMYGTCPNPCGETTLLCESHRTTAREVCHAQLAARRLMGVCIYGRCSKAGAIGHVYCDVHLEDRRRRQAESRRRQRERMARSAE